MISQTDFLGTLNVVPDCFPSVPLYTVDGRKVARIVAEKHTLRRTFMGSPLRDLTIYKPRVEFTDGSRCWPLQEYDTGKDCEYLSAAYCRHATRRFITT